VSGLRLRRDRIGRGVGVVAVAVADSHSRLVVVAADSCSWQVAVVLDSRCMGLQLVVVVVVVGSLWRGSSPGRRTADRKARRL